MSNTNQAAAATTERTRRKSRSQVVEVWRRLQKNRGAVIGAVIFVLVVLVAIIAPFFIDYETQVIGQNALERLQAPSLQHLMGTDEMGRDIFFRILYGARFSLIVGVGSTMIAAVIAITYGAIAGYFGGWVDNLIMRFDDIIGGIPATMLAMCIVAAFGTNNVNLCFALGITTLNRFSRTTRAAVMSISGSEFIEAARALGETEAQIIVKHILPNCLSPIIVQGTLRVGSCIVRASGLSFLGLGVAPPSPEWGAMLSAGRAYLRGQPYMTIFPGLAIFVTVVSLNLLGDGLRDALDPKQK